MSRIDCYLVNKATYDSLENKVETALYFITDTYQIFRGSVPYSHPVKIVSTLPVSDILPGTLYIDKTNHSLNAYDGNEWQTITPFPIVEEITSGGIVGEVASTKAVVEYVKSTTNPLIKSASINNKNLTIVKADGSTTTTAIQGFFDNASFDATNNRLIFTTNGGQEVAVPIIFPSDDFLKNSAWYVVTVEDVSHDPFVGYEVGDAGLLFTMESGRRLFVKIDLPDSVNVGEGKTDEIITAKSDGDIKASGKKIGGDTLKSSPDSNTVATELAVKQAIDEAIAELPSGGDSYVLRMTRPISDEALTPVVEISNEPDFVSIAVRFAHDAIEVEDKFPNAEFKVFDGKRWINFPLDGYLGTPFDNMPIVVDLGICRTNQYFGNEIPDRLYVRYYWMTSEGSESNYQATVVPSTSLQEPLQNIEGGTMEEIRDDETTIGYIPELVGGVQYQYGRGLQGLTIASTIDTVKESEILFTARNAATISQVEVEVKAGTWYYDEYNSKIINSTILTFNSANNWTISSSVNYNGDYHVASCSMTAKLVNNNGVYVISCIGSNHMNDNANSVNIDYSYNGIFASSIDMKNWKIVNSTCMIGGETLYDPYDWGTNLSYYGFYKDFTVSTNMQAETYVCPVVYPGSVALLGSSKIMEFEAGNKYVLNFRNNILGAAQIFLPESGFGTYLMSGNSVTSKNWLIESVTINSGNLIIVHSQGEADDITISSAGSALIKGGKIYKMMMDDRSFLTISSGGVVSSLDVADSATITIVDGNNNSIDGIGGASGFSQIVSHIRMRLYGNTTISGLTVIPPSVLVVESGTHISDCQIIGGGVLSGRYGATVTDLNAESMAKVDLAYDVLLGDEGKPANSGMMIRGNQTNISDGVLYYNDHPLSGNITNGVITNIVADYPWRFCVGSGIVVSNVEVTSGARIYAHETANVNDCRIVDGGNISLLENAVGSAITIGKNEGTSASATLTLRSIVSSATVLNGGVLRSYDGGSAFDTTVSEGGMIGVYDGGSASNIILSSGAIGAIYSGGTISTININGQSATFLADYYQGSNSQEVLPADDAIIDGMTVNGPAHLIAMHGSATLKNFDINCGNPRNTSDGKGFEFWGTTLSNGVIHCTRTNNTSDQMCNMRGGKLISCTISGNGATNDTWVALRMANNAGGANGPSYASSVIITGRGARLQLYSGCSASGITVSNNGHLQVALGASAFAVTSGDGAVINGDGYIEIIN